MALNGSPNAMSIVPYANNREIVLYVYPESLRCTCDEY